MQPQIDNYEAQMQQWQLVPHQVEQPQIVQRDQGGAGGAGGDAAAPFVQDLRQQMAQRQSQIDNYEAQLPAAPAIDHVADIGGGGGGGGITRAQVLALDRRNNDGASKNPYWSKDATSPAICVTGLLELLEQPCWTCNLPAPQSCTV
jgi:hypothetical protein